MQIEPEKSKGPTALALIRRMSAVGIPLLAARLSGLLCSLFAFWLTPLPALPQVALYLTALTLVSVGTFGRFELLVLSAKDRSAYSNASQLCVAAGGVAVLAIAILVSIAPFEAPIRGYSILFAIGLLARAWLRLGLVFSMRGGTQASAARAMAPHAIVQQCLLLGLLLGSCDALLAFALADIAGHLLAATWVYRNQRLEFESAFRTKASLRRVWTLLSSNFDLPTLNLGSTLSAAIFGMLPIFFLSGLPNTVVAGSMVLALKLLELPSYVLSGSVTPVVLNQLAQANIRGASANLASIFWLPLGLAVLVFGFVSLGGLLFSHLELLARWHLVFALLPLAALFQAGVVGSAPLIEAAGLVGYRSGMATLNVASLVLAGIAFWTLREDPVLALLIVGCCGVLRAGAMTRLLVFNNSLGSGTVAAVR